MSAIATYFQLTKPRLLPLVLFSGLPALVLAAGRWPSWELVASVIVGTALAAGAANALNNYLERDRDARMERTRGRPLPAGLLQPLPALCFALALGAIGTGTLWLWTGPLPALIALAAILFYAFVYTLWLKPRTPFAVVVGGVSGAIAPLIADAAIGGRVGLAGWILFGIIFLWQPPHFYAISLYRSGEYSAAGFPMLADRIGAEATRRRILVWIVALALLTLLPVGLGLLGSLYAAVAVVLDAWLLWQAIALLRRRDDAQARRLFRVSLGYLLGLFSAMIVDLAVAAWI